MFWTMDYGSTPRFLYLFDRGFQNIGILSAFIVSLESLTIPKHQIQITQYMLKTTKTSLVGIH